MGIESPAKNYDAIRKLRIAFWILIVLAFFSPVGNAFFILAAFVISIILIRKGDSKFGGIASVATLIMVMMFLVTFCIHRKVMTQVENLVNKDVKQGVILRRVEKSLNEEARKSVPIPVINGHAEVKE